METGDLELIYELSPMQQAMLFHSLYAPGSGVYVIQLSLRLSGRLDAAAFERAWQHVVDRHDILRTAFFWEGLEKPLQVVYREVALEVRREPPEALRGVEPEERKARLARFQDAERERGFDLAEAPLMRLALFELEPGVHQMVWTIHHLLVDGWSQGQLLQELFASYAAFSRGQEPRLPEAGKFRDYIGWLQRQDLGQAEAFWRDRLAGFSTPTFLAGGDGAPDGPSWRESRRRDLVLPAAATAALREAARRHRLTLNTLVQGAWSLLLAQESGRDDVVFGTTVSGRPADLPGVESILGLFINTQPVRVAVRPEQRLWDWLTRLQEDQVEMRRYEHSPLVDVQRWSGLAAGVPLFDHLLVFENLALPAELSRPLPELEIAEEAAHELTNYPLNMVVIPGGAELRLSLRHDAGRFGTAAVARMLERLALLLAALAEDRDPALGELPRMPEAERHQVLVEWGAAAPLPEGSSDTLHGRFGARARQTPDALAVTFDGVSVTYAELARRAHQLARHLRSLGVRPDDRVGLCGERSLELLEGLLGILEAGGAYVPLDPQYPRERLAWMIEDAGIRVVVGTAEALAALPADAAERVPLDAWRERLAALPDAPLPPVTDGSGLAYVIYTSGSTGRPKGVLVSHASVVRLFDATHPWFRFDARDVWTLFHSYAFDFSVWEIWGALLYGGRVVVVPWEVSRSPELFLDLLTSEKVTVLNQTPSAFAQLARVDEERGGVATGLRLVIFGGEALDVGGLAPWFDRHGDRQPRLVNMYGITETTVHVTYRPLRREDTEGARRSVIGARIPDLGLYVLDPWLQPAPIGVPGEIAVAGAGLARGYLNRPELTAERFVPDPVSGIPGARLYRSGDLGRFLPDGDLEYLGRIDLQVKIRGFRIELGEIEAVLASHPAVRECVVLARQDGRQGDVRLVAYLVARGDREPRPEELREHLRSRLPEHMVPAAFVLLPALPLTHNGKVDRKALPAPEGLRADEAGYVPPSDPVEERLAGIWAEVLGLDRVGIHDGFFDLGGHSLLATQVVSRIREAFGVEVPLRALFEAPTVAGLAERIDAQTAALLSEEDELAGLLDAIDFLTDEQVQAYAEDPQALEALARATVAARPGRKVRGLPSAPVPLPRAAGSAFPLSFAQQRLWFLDQLEPASPAYNIPLPVRLRGELPLALLERIAAEVVRRHETLRTTFAAREDEPVQVIHPHLRTGLSVVDLSDLPEAGREERAERAAQEEAWHPFDLRTGPLLRLTLVRLAAQDHLLLMTLHHIVSDGWSMRVLLREVAALYEAFSQGRPSPLPELPIQYADFAVWQRQWLQGEVLEEQLAFWKRQLHGAPQVLELPTDRPRPAAQTFRGAAVSRSLPPDTAAAVRGLCRQEDATLFMTVLAAWAALLGRHAGQEELLVGTPVAGRHQPGTEHLIGFFANTLVLRIGLEGDTLSFRTLLERVRHTALDAFTHQDIPFERLVEELAPVRDLARSPLFQVMLTLQNASSEAWRMPGLTIQPVPLEGQTSKFDLLLNLSETGDGGFACTLEYSTDLFDEDRMVRLLRHFDALLGGVAAAPDHPLATVPILTPEEQDHLLAAWSEPAEAFPLLCVHEPVEEQAERTPDALAAVWGGSGGAGLTYRELQRRARRLAGHLRSLGVGPDARVAVCLERSLDLPVAVLGVLQAGGAYVPIDPDYPADRVAFMLSDSRSSVLITTSEVAGRLPEHDGVRRVLLDADREVLAARDAGSPGRTPENPTPENLAYVIYTSGSTGKPKGVAVPHRVLANMLAWQSRASAAGPGSRTLQLSSLSFDVSFQEIFSTWWTGGTLVLVSQETRRDARELCRVLREQEVARLFLPFVALQQVAEAVEQGAPFPAALTEVITAGEQLRITPQIAAWLERSRASLENHYGPTEGHVITAHRLAGPPGGWPTLPPIGRPISNLRLVLLDRHFEPVPLGVPGHLCFGGAAVVRGYLDRPELTAERFLPDPFGAEPGARLYATGDLARYLPDGTLQLLGRIDHQVKIRGFRVEPGEVEAVLSRHPGVREAAVVVRGEGVERRLVGYWVPADGSLAGSGLRAFLAAELPEYLVPSVLVPLEALPLTPSGKVDRRALPDPQGGGEEEGWVEPSGPVEELLAGIWGEVLGRGRVGAHDDFFALGGHSLLATRVVSRLRAALGVEVPLRQLFETPTVAGFARAVRAAGRAAGQDPALVAPPIVPVPRDGDLPLSFAQQRLWLIDQIEPDSPAYNIPLAVRLTGKVAPGLLARVFAEIVRRHETLRTTFGRRGDQPVQVIAPVESAAARPALPLLDLSGLPAPEREAQARALARDDARRPFDLRRGPLLRMALVRLVGEDHLLLLNLHHIVTDGWSMGVLLREIAALHEAFSQGRPSPLPELPIQYGDFAVWQRRWMRGEILEAQLDFWKQRLDGAPQVLELPTDRPRPAVQTSRGAAQPVALTPALSDAVLRLGRSRRVTPFMTLLAGWSALLGRLAGQDDLLIGTPIAGRNRRETEDLIGFFVNTLALRADLSGSPDFLHLLDRIRDTTFEAFIHQDLPFERLVEELVPERDLSRSPLFQVVFALQNAPAGALRIPGLALAPLDVESGLAKFDLLLALAEEPVGGERAFRGALEHNTDLFDPGTAERLASRFVRLLDAAVAAPETPLADLPLLFPEELEQVLHTWNDTATGYPREATLPELFEEVAREHPDAPALVSGDEVWTYRRLAEASGHLARHLRSLGVGPETAVGLCLERSAELILGTLAILRAGGFYVPLDPTYPDERLDFMLEDTGARIVLVHAATRERMEGRARLVGVDEGGWQGEEVAPLAVRMPAESLAYVIYTSGSTGRPKGVAVPHRAIVRLVRETDYVRLGPGDRTGHVANISFDAATYEIWGALLTGAAAVVIPRETVLAPHAFAAALRGQRVTSMFLTAALFTKMSREAPDAFQHMSELLVGGEAVDPVAARTVLAGRPPRRLLNGYGPTESTTFAAWHHIREVPAEATNIPIGQPLAQTTLYVLDRSQALVPPGSVGELYIGGDGLARGYLRRPELTAERFVPHPWGRGERLYRTGDLARRRPDGPIEYLGRLDDQVKIRGFRIEPGEIEAVLAGHPEVRECAVLARRDLGGAGETRLVAYAALHPDSVMETPEADLRAWLQERLPDYMVPAAWVLLDALPLTANGKLDRRALPAPQAPDLARGAGRGYVAPSGPVEEALAAIWAEVLRLDRVGAEDDFFALGGHSLLATQVVTRVRETLGVELPLRRVFEAPTLRQLAGSVREARTGSAGAPLLAQAPVQGGQPLSFAQQRLWILDQLEPGNPAYNIPLAVRLTGELSVSALERTFVEVVRRHEALRTTFAVEDGEPVQVIADLQALRPELPVLDLSDAPEEAREEWVGQLVLEEARHPFDLQRGPLLRLGLIRLAEREHLLTVTLHHIVSDGWSMGVLLREIGALYAAFVQGEPSPLPELPLQYADFARWQRGWLQGEVLEEQLAYWKGKLAGAPALLELPTDRPRPAVQTWGGASVGLTLPPALSAAFRDLCQREGVTPFMLLLAAWAVLLGRHAGQEDVLVGSPIAGRNRREIEDLIGFFVNTLVFRVRLGELAFVDLLGHVRATALEAFTHQDLPFERIVEEVVPERDLAHSPLFQVLFALQNAPGGGLSLPGLTLAPVDLDARMAKFDLSLAVWEGEDGFAGALEHNTDLFDGSTAERLLARFQALLEGAVADPGQKIWDLPLLLEGERQQVLVEPNAERREPPREATIPELFAAVVAASPDAPAVVFAGEPAEVLSYADLDRRSARWAGVLRGLGVGPETRVGICVRRSPRMLVGLLAVLRAGGAYVPLDPAWPAERLALMIGDAGVDLVLVEEGTAGRLPGDLRFLFLDREPQEELNSPLPLPDPSQAAYIIYTSGSTGRPKGVVALHGGLAAFSQALAEVMELSPEDRVLQFASLSFDASAVAIYPALIRGAAVVLHPDPASLTPRDLMALCVAQGLTVLELPAALWRLTVREAETAGLRFVPEVRLFMTGGESLSSEALRQWGRSVDPAARLVSSYGPTEATVVATVYPAAGGEAAQASLAGSPLGAALRGTGVYLLDPRLVPVPLDVPGELFLGGVGITRGYLGRPDLTAERFVPDPWGPPGSRLYRTGDRARRRPDGGLDFLGRVDQQVKIRGFRIEPGEIEALLGEHPEVREALVLARSFGAGDLRLVAYVTLREGSPVREEELRAWLRERVPEHLVPAAFVRLDAFPLAPTGKVDRRALPAPERPAGEATYVAPGDRLQELLADIWQEVLGLGRIGIHDNFFTLGGHSLLATQVVTRVREVLGIEVPLRRVFEAPTLAQFAHGLRVARPDLADAAVEPGARPDTAPPIVPVPRDAAGLPLSFAQQRLWFLDQLEPGNPAYHLPHAVRLTGEADPALLARIFTELARRHESLRTTFASREGEPVQLIAAPETARPEVSFLDLSGLPEAEREERALRLARDEAVRPFDLRRGPLLRLTLVRLAGQDHLLLLTMHHIVSDGWSMGVLLREIAALHEAFAEGRPSPLPELSLHYADYAVWQRGWLQGEVLEAQLSFWRNRLAGAPRLLELPTDRPRPAVQTYNGTDRRADLPPALSAAVRELCRREEVTPFMALLAAWAVLLGRHAGQDDVLVGSPIAGRSRREIEDLVGFFVNTLVLRIRLEDVGFAGLLRQVRSVALDAYAHQDLPFERIVEEVGLERDLSHSPLFQALFALQNAPLGTLRIPGLVLAPLPLESRVAKFDLSLALRETAEGFTGRLEHNTDLFDGTTAARFLARFEALLEGAVADPGRALADLPLLLPAERHQALEEWNDTRSAYPGEACLPELFAAVARELPDAPAIVTVDEVWSYRRLDEAASRLARRLQRLGVGPETAVGLSLERSPELIVGTLAILEAGGFYVPLDPAYPDERLAFMLADTGARVVVMHEATRERLERLGGGVRLVPVDEADQEAEGPLGRWMPAESLAYVIYTSGSTGRPKGVGVPHRAIVRLVRGTNYVRLGPGDRTGQVANASFDAATYEIWGALLNGAAVAVIPRETVLSAPRFAAALRDLRVTSMFLTSALFTRMSREAPEAFAEMSELLVGGEAVDPVAARTVLAGRPPRRLLNGYGPTESTTFAAWHPIRDVAPEAVSVPIGLPLANTTLYVLDREGSPVPPGAAGELHIGGDGLARGYVNRPELTAERFVPHPWVPGGRLYRTGDLVRQRPEGAIEFLGRLDSQVKIRGFRIEPGEIEAVLAGHPEVRECAVLARRDEGSGETRLAAYAVLDPESTLRNPPADLHAWLRERLPDYMIPSAFVLLEAFPLTANGKLDRGALPEPGRVLAPGQDFVPPRDELELRLARIWEDLLDLRPVGVRDSFFRLGGHSLLAVRLVGSIEKQLGCQVPLTALMAAPTVEQMARVVRQERQERQGEKLPRSLAVPLEASGAEGRPPLFLVHPVGGNTFCYLPLLGPGRLGVPVWGLQSPDPADRAEPWTLEAMAAHYLAAVREIQPGGRYRLAGWSMGGVVAFEMARQLTEQGGEVELLAMIDPGLPLHGSKAPDPRRELAQFLVDLRGLVGVGATASWTLPEEVTTIDGLLEREEVRALLPADVSADQLRELFTLFAANRRALAGYRPRPWGGRLTLIRAEATAAAQPEGTAVWSGLARAGAEVHILPGDHYSLLRAPHAAALSGLLADCLERAAAVPLEAVRAEAGRTWRETTARLAVLSPEKRELLDALLRERRAASLPASTIPPREDPEAPVPLSFSQERMWFFNQLDPATAAHNIFLGVRLDGELRPALLAAGFTELTRRHQVLITRYEVSGTAPVQKVDPGRPFRLPGIDLSALPAERRAAELDRLQAEESARPFDLVRGPVLRASLVRLEPAEHVLLLTVHHIALDGWSLRILLNELAALYEAFVTAGPSPLPAPRLQYADYAVWQRRSLQGEALAAELAWWRRELAPPLPVLSLPTDRPRRVPQPFRLADETGAFPAGLTADLHALGTGRNASLFMVLLAGLAAILHRLGGDERILVGTPVAGRNRKEVEGLIGFFLNNLVLRVDLDGDPGFGSLLESAARTALEAFAHQDLPIEMLVQELRSEGGDAAGSRGPFQVMLLLQNLRTLRIEVPGLVLTALGGERDVDLNTVVLDLGLTVQEHGGELLATMSYNGALFEAPMIRRLLGHLRVLLESAVADPGAPLSVLPLLSPAEQREVLTWNRPVAAGPGEAIPALFAARAARTPDAEALRHEGRRMSYGELERRSRGLAERLNALGVGPEVPVALFLERSPELIAALLGVLRAGGAYAPLEPRLPAERLAWILEDLAPAVLVTDSALANRISWTGKTLFVDREDGSPLGLPLPPAAPGQAAYILYTSGSTGRPKGVVVHHGALASFVAAAGALYGIGPEDRVLQFASLGFDTSVEEIWPCLTAGGTLVLRTDEMAGTVAGFLQACEESGITVLDLPTAFWHELAISPELEERGLPPSVRLLILGGERPLPERVASWLRRADARVRLFNTYGPTEATVVAAAAELPPALAGEIWREVPMGRPLGGVQAHVLDRALSPVPVGVPGEILVGGRAVARGYLGRPDLTAERFLPDPFSGIVGARLYRTGDLARRRVDGSLEFAGRVDQQVKIRGFRVEPGEIESVLATRPEVAKCTVIARPAGPREELRLVAYLVPAPGREAVAGELRAFLEGRLPAWMVPSAFVPLQALPLTPTGKIDREALPAPEAAGLAPESPGEAPRNEIEEVIAEIWRDILGRERLSVFDSFFELGGHSLLLLQVMRRLRDTFELEIPLRSIFEERTIAGLAKKIEELLIEEVRAAP